MRGQLAEFKKKFNNVSNRFEMVPLQHTILTGNKTCVINHLMLFLLSFDVRNLFLWTIKSQVRNLCLHFLMQRKSLGFY